MRVTENLLRAGVYGLWMVQVVEWNDRHILELSEGYLPDKQHLEGVLSSRMTPGEEFDFETREEAAAWLITTFCRSKSLGTGYPGSLAWRFYTWVFGPSRECEDGILQDWFEPEASNTDYRVFLYYKPRFTFPGGRIPRNYWSYARRRIGVKQREGKYADRIPNAREFLDRVLRAYYEGDAAVESCMKNSGQPVWGSRGFTFGYLE